MDERKDEGLKALGKVTDYKTDYDPSVLETFINKHPENDYWVRFNCPEFTSLCPITGGRRSRRCRPRPQGGRLNARFP